MSAEILSLLNRFCCSAEHTTSIFALPFSFTLNGKDSCSPLSCSLKVKKAWCGRAPDFPSFVVKEILSESPAESANDEDVSGEVGESLR